MAPGSRAGGRLVALLAAFVLLASAGRLAWVSARQLEQRHDLMLEGSQLASVLVLREGLGLYERSTWDGPPFTLTMYTPLYFHLMAALPFDEARPFLAGRLLSLACVLGMAALLFAMPRRGRRGLLPPALGAAAFLMLWTVTRNATYLRLDPLAMLLSACGVLLAWRRTRAAVAAAAACFLLALATKQAHVAGAAACLAWLWLVDRGLARLLAALLGGGLLAGAALAHAAWGEGFWFSTVGATTTPLSWASLGAVWRMVLPQPLFLLLVALTAWTAAAAIRREGAVAFARSPALLYVLVSFAVVNLTSSKAGSWDWHLLPFLLAQAIWLVGVFSEPEPATAPAVGGRLRAAALGALVAAAGFELWATVARPALVSYARGDPEAAAHFEAAARQRLADAGAPDATVLNLGPPAHVYGIAERVCLNDYFLYSLMWTTGRLDPGPLVDAVRGRAFDAVLLTAQLPPIDALEPPWDALGRALAESYRPIGRDAVYSYHVR